MYHDIKRQIDTVTKFEFSTRPVKICWMSFIPSIFLVGSYGCFPKTQVNANNFEHSFPYSKNGLMCCLVSVEFLSSVNTFPFLKKMFFQLIHKTIMGAIQFIKRLYMSHIRSDISLIMLLYQSLLQWPNSFAKHCMEIWLEVYYTWNEGKQWVIK